jgi:sec-independent protein translocase protein TatC
MKERIPMKNQAEPLNDQPLTEHLRELRSCLIYSFIAVFIGFCLSYLVIRPIGTWFFKPLVSVLPEGTSLIFTSYQEGFFFT